MIVVMKENDGPDIFGLVLVATIAALMVWAISLAIR